jgi:DNA-binding transcriptional ArsR family regulator
MKTGSWSTLRVFQNDVRIEILRFLLLSEMACLTDINKNLERALGRKLTLPAVLKHMRLLEKAGLVRLEPGIYGEPDARKTLYLLEGKERVSRILVQLERDVCIPMLAGAIFNKTAKLARRVQTLGPIYARGSERQLESLLSDCEAQNVYCYLTEDEKKKVKFWKMMIGALK